MAGLIVQSYGIEVEEDLLTALVNLYSVNSTNPHNTTLSIQRQANATEFLGELLTIPTDRALSGILWLFPCAVSLDCVMRKDADRCSGRRPYAHQSTWGAVVPLPRYCPLDYLRLSVPLWPYTGLAWSA